MRPLLVAFRKQTGADPRQPLFPARRQLPYDRLPSVSRVSLILREDGLVDRVRYLPPNAESRGLNGPSRSGTVPNVQWTVDSNGHFGFGDWLICHPLTAQDDATRYVLCVDGYGSTSTAAVERIFRKRGLPERIHSDNGAPFASPGVGRLSRVSVEWMRQGIEVCRYRAGK